MIIFPTLLAVMLGMMVASSIGSTFSSGGGLISGNATHAIDTFIFTFIFFFLFWSPSLALSMLLFSRKVPPKALRRAWITLALSLPPFILALWFYLEAPSMSRYHYFHL